MINILYFQAKWCSGCNALKPSINEASHQPNVRVKTIDTDYDISTTQQYNVSSIPTVILVDDNGTEIRRFVGNKSRTEIEKFING